MLILALTRKMEQLFHFDRIKTIYLFDNYFSRPMDLVESVSIPTEQLPFRDVTEAIQEVTAVGLHLEATSIISAEGKIIKIRNFWN